MDWLKNDMSKAGASGLLLGALIMHLALPYLVRYEWWPGHNTHNHSTKYHIHADFLVVVNDEIIDLSKPEFISTSQRKLSDDVHLHDGDGKVEHLHAEGITFANFLSTLGITLTTTCLTLKEAEAICQSNETEVALYVNSERFRGDITTYIPEDLDRVLLYVGASDETVRGNFRSQVEDRACLFSGSCPERGIPPPENCGLTCEI
jgi:hypothetical protein